ncbi:MAG TPA: protein-disulfide reductase DsbD domain-containing protein [Chitinophagaceae bacterium]|nr:protein-disulfide reductase DsbD domain-containing protein [Chitinophagaceae bacterium]
MIRKITGLALLLLIAVIAKAQLNPVSWNFSAKKIDDKTYELHMKANMQPGWHLFSQTQPDDAIAIPTGFVLNKNPLVSYEGRIREQGTLEKFHDKKLDLSANQYSNTVNFVQMVKLKARVKTTVTGTVEYQTCNDEKCLPPRKVNFSIPIQ